MFRVVWSRESKNQFDRIVHYLRTNWSEKEVTKFTSKLREFEEKVCEYPQLFAASALKPNFRRAVIGRHNSVIYTVDEANKLIRVFTIFDNRQKPDKIK